MKTQQVSKAANMIVYHGIANHANPNVQEQLQAKFPTGKKLLPQTLTKVSPIDQIKNLWGTLLSFPAAVDSGSRGLRNQYLVALGESMKDHKMKQLDRLGMANIMAKLPTWFYMVWLSLQAIALYKSAEEADVGPFSLRNSLIKVFNREVLSQSKVELRQYVEPVQLG